MSRHSVRTTAALSLIAVLTHAAVGSAQVDAPPVRVLVVTGGHSFHPDFFTLFEGHHDLAVTRVAHPEALARLSPEGVKSYDVVVLYDMYQEPTPDRARRGFRSLLEGGNGLVVLHHALASYGDWPGFQELIGGRYFLADQTTAAGRTIPRSTYRHDVRLQVQIADPGHPIVRGLDDFELLDEAYGGFAVDPGVHQLLRTDHESSGPVIGWCRTHGNGRVVVLQSGHDENAYRHSAYRQLVARSIRWAAGRLTPVGEDGADADHAFRRLFNGRDLAGWEPTGKAHWEVVDGILRGTQGPEGAAGDLFSEEEFGDFELVVTLRVRWPANSGIWFRYQAPDHTYQADILEWPDPRCFAGTIYRPGKMFIALNTDESRVRREGWNTMRVRAVGDRMTVDLNGARVAEARDDLVAKGRVGFQVHAGVEFESMAIEVLAVRVRAAKSLRRSP